MTEIRSGSNLSAREAGDLCSGLAADVDAELLNDDEADLFISSLQEEALSTMRGHQQSALGQIMERVSRDLDPLCGQQLGEYLIDERISWTPSSRVFLARRVQGYSQPVVVKVISELAGGDEQYLKRFERERQFLAGLKSPSVATILDGGTTPEGFPYLVMEYVEGEHLDHYCDQHCLSITERLKLFQSICDAVTYCHQHGVIHRDLKPNNILVTKTGQIKLVDFGLARLVEERPEFAGLSITVTRKNGYTPEYASPEQVSGQSISTRSDVYSLGVILYELLTGQRPYRVDVRNLLETSEIINTFIPPTPSRVVWKKTARGEESDTQLTVCRKAAELRGTTPERLAHQLRGDLDNIVKMALRKEPDRRYQSAVELSADLTRYFEHEPLLAQRESRSYVMKKFMRRHWLGLSLVLSISLLLTGGVWGTTWGLLRALKAEKLAKQHENRAIEKSQEVDAARARLDLTESQYQKLVSKENQRILIEVSHRLLPEVHRGADGFGEEMNSRPFLRRPVEDEYLKELMIRSMFAVQSGDLPQCEALLELLLFHYLGEEQACIPSQAHTLHDLKSPHPRQHFVVPNPVMEMIQPTSERGDSRSSLEPGRQ